MCWYRVFSEDEYQDFDTFAQAKSYYDSCLKNRWQNYKKMNILENWEEDKKWFDLSIIKMETILTPAIDHS